MAVFVCCDTNHFEDQPVIFALLKSVSINIQPQVRFRIAAAVTAGIITCTVGFILALGKQQSFILINGNYNPALDAFFRYVTFLGDGIIFIPIVVYCLLYNRRYLIAVIAGIVISTVISQGMKLYIFPDDLRPWSIETAKVIIHKVEGVPLHRLHSFPSGHTTTAFTVALLLASILQNRIWCFVLPVVAMLVGYSRVYLAQHFVTDVCAGMCIGLFSAWVSLLIYLRATRPNNKGQQSSPAM